MCDACAISCPAFTICSLLFASAVRAPPLASATPASAAPRTHRHRAARHPSPSSLARAVLGSPSRHRDRASFARRVRRVRRARECVAARAPSVDAATRSVASTRTATRTDARVRVSSARRRARVARAHTSTRSTRAIETRAPRRPRRATATPRTPARAADALETTDAGTSNQPPTCS